MKTKNSRCIEPRPALSGHNGRVMAHHLVGRLHSFGHRAPGKKETMGPTEEGPYKIASSTYLEPSS